MKLYGSCHPYLNDSDDKLQEITQYQTFFTLFIGLLISSEYLSDTPAAEALFGGLLIVINVLATALAPILVSDLFMCCVVGLVLVTDD